MDSNFTEDNFMTKYDLCSQNAPVFLEEKDKVCHESNEQAISIIDL